MDVCGMDNENRKVSGMEKADVRSCAANVGSKIAEYSILIMVVSRSGAT